MFKGLLLLSFLVAFILGGHEALWRFDHPLERDPSPSPNGTQIAELRALPEGSKVPYGIGVFVGSRWTFLRSFQSELAFGAYCGDINIKWRAEQRLAVDCELLEGEPYVAGPVLGGTAVEVAIRRKVAANRSIDADVLSAGFAHLLSAGHFQR